MAQAVLSAASALQAKSDFLNGGPITVALDSPCQEGNTVTIELFSQAVAFFDFAPGYSGAVPDGFELDSCVIGSAAKFLYTFRKRNVAAGEQSWQFNSILAPLSWMWRVTEWNTDLEPISPLEGFNGEYRGFVNAPATLSSGIAPPNGNTGRDNCMALGWHMFFEGAADAGTFSWSDLTNGFVVRDSLVGVRIAAGSSRYWATWSWKFASVPSQFETTATANRTGGVSGDNYAAMMTVYAATTYA